MTNEEARRVMKGMGAKIDEIGELVGKGRNGIVTYRFEASRNEKDQYWPTTSMLEGDFTADQLEALAIWMRDPKGVMGD